jgi:hypothetical protein
MTTLRALLGPSPGALARRVVPRSVVAAKRTQQRRLACSAAAAAEGAEAGGEGDGVVTGPGAYGGADLQITAQNARISSVEFVKGSVKLSQCPAPLYPEIAIIGRSNVGKSSLINLLTNSMAAKVSQRPGKTQQINHFKVTSPNEGPWYLVDLPVRPSRSLSVASPQRVRSPPLSPLALARRLPQPPHAAAQGYGFASAPKKEREKWSQFSEEYVLGRENLIAVMLLVDSTARGA